MAALTLSPNLATWAIAALATLGVIVRPFSWPEAIWAVAGALALVLLGLMPAGTAWEGVLKGTDVYLFLVGMMLMSEVARKEGLFDWLAGIAVRTAKGSATRLFTLVYLVGTVVTVFLSNDACAVVLTPAVYAATRAAKVENPLPYLFICAFIANAASFVLPISNPANLVVFAEHMPPLTRWLALFGLPSLLAIGTTYLVLRLTQNGTLKQQSVATDVEATALSRTGIVAGLGIVATGAVLIGASALGRDLGLPTFVAGLATTLIVLALRRGSGAVEVVKDVSWSVLPLVAGLFVLVEALEKTGVLAMIADALKQAATAAPTETAWGAGALIAIACNFVNNLPAGLIAGAAVQAAHVPEKVAGAVLIGVDLGPNLSVTGSLATILWLTAIRREGQDVSFWSFLKLGLVVMPPALALALAGLLLV
ncbi:MULTISPECIES: arsenic transporter [Methylobacterium]|jgi:arsenical pump membrane protein|uniref:arsenic transporter n=1 Tax=Methylobacterium TaxID=407 RepID=UPI0008E3C4CA|nr:MULTISPECIES: arsenic transporter [Methylobacterium]MBZ6416842.1 arsenic transporter [Methylobacterium sp.]MBK3398998.1 arsenic transporter [Methylobacterium ajmalii]MBK3410683.1 arsenic transporter [Methylobacterium ajmalii]MBK3420472.1 arsenic transporter [Methylobacterium ajmalii]SFF33338.1 arsenical pump membrane protein [Methylobacterium sp. yr596]